MVIVSPLRRSVLTQQQNLTHTVEQPKVGHPWGRPEVSNLASCPA